MLPFSNALFVAGGSALVFGAIYLLIKSVAWVGRGLRSNVIILRPLVGLGTLTSVGVLIAGGVTIASAFPLQEWERGEAGPSATELYLQSVKAPSKPSTATVSSHEAACIRAATNVKRYLGTIITQDEFQAVKLGMTYEKAVEVIGSEGRETDSRILYDGTKTSDYAWNNSGGRGGSASMHFENGTVKSKTPINLPTRAEIQAAAKEYEPCR
ncbi:MAG: hypothetical protein Q8R82_13410 [Hyphomonadaceae bacterium]|nr:hypothetical protein [Hyphomonadaceae bacterium]